MKPEKAWKHFLLAFVIALVGYITFYSFIEHHCVRRGPWQITFASDAAGVPVFLINQPGLGVSNVVIAFQNIKSSSSRPLTLSYSQPQATPFTLPFGQCVFMDLTSLPGTLVFEMFGHEIQLLPRVLTIDQREYPWASNTNIVLFRRKSAP